MNSEELGEKLLKEAEMTPTPRVLNAAKDFWQHRSRRMVCATCMWYVPKAKSSGSKNTVQIGRCKRHAPTMNGFPVVLETDWCGDHKLDENAEF